MGPTFQLRLFGGFSIYSEKQGDIVVARGRGAELLARVVLSESAGCTRASLAEEFWPGADPTVSRHRLCQMLSSLRMAFKAQDLRIESFFEIGRQQIRFFDRVVPTDVAAFESAMQRGDWRTASRLYRGELMPGADNLLISTARDRLRFHHIGALWSLTTEYERVGEFVAAAEIAMRLSAAEPDDEANALLVIRLLLKAGSIDAARRRYRKLRRDHLEIRKSQLPPAARQEVRAWFAEAVKRVAARVELDRDVPWPEADLPLPTTRFFGRQAETARLIADLSTAPRTPASRLMSIVGPAGVGKTRLALETASHITHRQPFFVELADIDDARLIADKILNSLHCDRKPHVHPMAQVISELSRRRLPVLLILDNIEHLLPQTAAARSIQSLLLQVPDLICLVTSRQVLDLEGEQVTSVHPLPVPPSEAEANPETLVACASTALFVDRLRSIRPDFRVNARNAPAIASLCHHLDGLPLALELVASWARTLTPAEMVAQLRDRRRILLTNRSLNSPARHMSLEAAIDWSFGLLTPDLQRFFAALHVFRGAFTPEAAGAVFPCPDAAGNLALLAERSFLVAVDANDDGVRYRLLETLREYGRERSAESEQAELSRRHADYYLGLARETGGGIPTNVRDDRLELEITNLRAALEWCDRESTRADPTPLHRMVLAMRRFWLNRGYRREAQTWFQRATDLFTRDDALDLVGNEDPSALDRYAHIVQALAASREQTGGADRALLLQGMAGALYARVGNVAAEALVLNFQGNLSLQQGCYRDAESFFLRSLALSPASEGRYSSAVALHYLGILHTEWGQYAEARDLLEQSSTLYGAPDAIAQAGIRASQAILCWHQGELDEAERLFLLTLDLRRRQGYRAGESLCTTMLGMIASLREDHTSALHWHAEALALVDETEDPVPVAFVLGNRGVSHLRGGDYLAADADLTRALELRRAAANRWGIAHALEHQADLLVLAHADFAGAIALWAEAEVIRESLESPVIPVERPWRDARESEARAALGNETFASLWRAARTSSHD